MREEYDFSQAQKNLYKHVNCEDGFPVWDVVFEEMLCKPEEIAENNRAAQAMIKEIDGRNA